jgi:hypothetical protein
MNKFIRAIFLFFAGEVEYDNVHIIRFSADSWIVNRKMADKNKQVYIVDGKALSGINSIEEFDRYMKLKAFW